MTGFRRHLVGDPLVLEAVRQVLVIVMVRDAERVGLAVLAEFVADVFRGNVIRHHDRPFDGAHEGIQLVVLVAQGVQAAHEAAHAGARDDVDGDSQLFHILDHAQVREAAGAAAGEDEAHRGPVLPDGVEACANLRERGFIGGGIRTGQDGLAGGIRRSVRGRRVLCEYVQIQGTKNQEDRNPSFHHRRGYQLRRKQVSSSGVMASKQSSTGALPRAAPMASRV